MKARPQGRVRSWLKYGAPAPRILRASMTHGYPGITLCKSGQQANGQIHVLILLAFIGPRPSGAEIRHLDGDSANSVLTNLAYGTESENQQDSLRHGTQFMANRETCPANHLYDEANTYVYRGSRSCRECGRTRSRIFQARKRAVAKAEEAR